jgi:biotin synthase
MLSGNKHLRLLVDRAAAGRALTKIDSFFLISRRVDVWDLLYGAHIIRERFFRNKSHLCSIINAKSGNCSEDCKFCAQSIRHKSAIKTYKLVSSKTIKKAYYKARNNGADGFSIVTSGNKLSERELERLSNVVHNLHLRNKKPYTCLSVGCLSSKGIAKLKKSGVKKCHHNLETSRNFFSNICSTHSYSDRIKTIKELKNGKMKVCSGGVFGLGEGWKDRIDLAFTLKELNVDSIPLNFLMPVAGTSLEKMSLLPPLEVLKIIALFRFILPDKNILVCAGREKVLRDLQSLIFYAGATGMMTGGYLTQPGRTTSDDLQMLSDLELRH